jgi:hypothetical protein
MVVSLWKCQAGGGTQAKAATRPGGGMTGITTYYTGSGGSDGVAGGPTANGEIYNPNAMTTAVQRSLRGKYLNKWLLVEDLDTASQFECGPTTLGLWVVRITPLAAKTHASLTYRQQHLNSCTEA